MQPRQRALHSRSLIYSSGIGRFLNLFEWNRSIGVLFKLRILSTAWIKTETQNSFTTVWQLPIRWKKGLGQTVIKQLICIPYTVWTVFKQIRNKKKFPTYRPYFWGAYNSKERFLAWQSMQTCKNDFTVISLKPDPYSLMHFTTRSWSGSHQSDLLSPNEIAPAETFKMVTGKSQAFPSLYITTWCVAKDYSIKNTSWLVKISCVMSISHLTKTEMKGSECVAAVPDESKTFVLICYAFH